MRKRVIYRYVGKDAVMIAGKMRRPGTFISQALYRALPKEVTIRQELYSA